GVSFRQVVEDVEPGVARVDLTVAADTQGVPASTTFCVDLPGTPYAGGQAEWIGASGGQAATPLAQVQGIAMLAEARQAQGVRFVADSQWVEVRFTRPVELRLGRSARNGGSIRLEVLLLPAGASRGDSVRHEITIAAGGTIDRTPVAVQVEASRPGRAFDGLGGNFRLQNAADPQVVRYNLEN